MFYFFKRGNETLRCEVRSAVDGPGYEIVVVQPDGHETTERVQNSDDVHRRWLELHEKFQQEGWWGPATQDGRG